MKAISGKNRMLTIALSGALAMSTVGVVLAQQGGSGGSTGGVTTADQAPADREGRGPGGHLGPRELAKASGLSETVFQDGFKAGKSVNQVLSENGKDSATVQAALLADLKAHLDQGVKDGKLTQAQADAAYAQAQTNLPKQLDQAPQPGQRPAPGAGGPKDGPHGEGGLMKIAADTIGIDVKALMTELQGGKSIAEVASAHNVSAQTIIDKAVADANAHIDQAVKDGKLTADQATQAKQHEATEIADHVNNAMPAGRGLGHDGGHERGHRGPGGPGATTPGSGA